MTEDKKLCKNCDWCAKYLTIPWRCERPVKNTDLLVGDYVEQLDSSCWHERDEKYGECKPEGKYFLQRRPWWRRFLRLL